MNDLQTLIDNHKALLADATRSDPSTITNEEIMKDAARFRGNFTTDYLQYPIEDLYSTLLGRKPSQEIIDRYNDGNLVTKGSLVYQIFNNPTKSDSQVLKDAKKSDQRPEKPDPEDRVMNASAGFDQITTDEKTLDKLMKVFGDF